MTRPTAIATTAAAFSCGAGPALAARPRSSASRSNETVVDEALSEERGVDVLTTARGHAILRTYHRAGTGPVDLTTINVI